MKIVNIEWDLDEEEFDGLGLIGTGLKSTTTVGIGKEVLQEFADSEEFDLRYADKYDSVVAALLFDRFQVMPRHFILLDNNGKVVEIYGKPTKLRAVDIEWDLDGEDSDDPEDYDLPLEVDVPKGLEDSDSIEEWLSDEFGFCHSGFDLVRVDDDEALKEFLQSTKEMSVF